MAEHHGHHIDYVKVYWVLARAPGRDQIHRPLSSASARSRCSRRSASPIIKAYLVVKNFMHINLTLRGT